MKPRLHAGPEPEFASVFFVPLMLFSLTRSLHQIRLAVLLLVFPAFVSDVTGLS